jgi:hypothetical protein
MKTKTILAIAAAVVFPGVLAIACSSKEEATPECSANDPACANADVGGDDTSAFADGTGYDTQLDWAPGETITLDGGGKCVPGPTQCTDCVDNDGDGLIDWMDPECTSPLDRDENSFGTGIPGDNIDPCKQDCWFDGNSGAGDDGCNIDGRCLKGSTEPRCPYGGDAWASNPANCPKPTAKCIEYCGKLTPKGCDCLGCCEVFDPAGVRHLVKLVGECTYETLTDATKCPPCTQVPECTPEPPCGKCDWCLGKTSLPAECSDAGVDAGGCDNGMPACSPTQACPFPDKQYCLTGCCVNRVG